MKQPRGYITAAIIPLANFSSQFDMLWRIMLGYPLKSKHIVHAAIVNLMGGKGYSGEAHYEGIDEILKMENVF